jgi:hypothetical protein
MSPSPDSDAPGRIPAYFFLFATFKPILLVAGPFAGSTLGYAWTALYFFVVVPVVDFIVGPMKHAACKQSSRLHKAHSLPEAPAYRAVLLCHVATCFAALMYAVCVVSVSAELKPVTTAQSILYALSGGCVALSAAISGHELIHSLASTFDRWVGGFCTSVSLNPVYSIDHLAHHKFVGTDHDAGSAKRGQSIYAFFVRYQIAGWKNAIMSTVESYRRSKDLAMFASTERFIPILSLSFALVWSVCIVSGRDALLMYLSMGCISVLSLGAIDYSQHYGLRRSVDGKTGEIEPMKNKHSWEGKTGSFSTLCVFAGDKHAEHHIDSSVPFPELDSSAGPQYPISMVAINVVAFIPPLFHRIACPILDSLED